MFIPIINLDIHQHGKKYLLLTIKTSLQKSAVYKMEEHF